MYLITGCSSGLGFEIANQLLRKNQKVLGFSRSIGKAVAFNDNDDFNHYAGDLMSPDDLTLLNDVLGLDGEEINLVLNAAQFEFEGAVPLGVEKSKEMFGVNYFSAIALVEKFEKKGLKRVLFVNSVAGLHPQSGQGQYSASKHALQAYSEALAKYSVGRDFDVMTINPGGIDSELWDNVNFLEKSVRDSFIQPSTLAGLICNLLELPYKTYIRSFTVLPEHDV